MKSLKSIFSAEKWAWPDVCPKCGRERSPDDPLSIMNIFFPSAKCPICKSKLELKKHSCPACGKQLPEIRRPLNLRMALWGGHYCKECNVELDKWGRRI